LPAVEAGHLQSFASAIETMQAVGFKRSEWELQAELVHRVRSAALSAGAWSAALSSMGPAVLIVAPDLAVVSTALHEAFADRLILEPITISSVGITVTPRSD
jgi:predicted sugar kinase